eukprot:GHVS01093368.1.p1 GENE.GHVS01093368.1~~GHVS01093368.1.p1  ORF type:complete len:117 (-),score=18.57 GHVS01093368.1:70-390(-)
MEAINSVRRLYHNQQKQLILQGLSLNCVKMCAKANHILHYIDAATEQMDILAVPRLYERASLEDVQETKADQVELVGGEKGGRGWKWKRKGCSGSRCLQGLDQNDS